MYKYALPNTDRNKIDTAKISSSCEEGEWGLSQPGNYQTLLLSSTRTS